MACLMLSSYPQLDIHVSMRGPWSLSVNYSSPVGCQYCVACRGSCNFSDVVSGGDMVFDCAPFCAVDMLDRY